MTTVPFNFGKWFFGPEANSGIEFAMPIYIWQYWRLKTSNDNGLLLLRNSFFHKFNNVSWHSNRHFPQIGLSLRYRAMQAICQGDVSQVEACIREGWDPNSSDSIDYEGRFTGVSLAAYLDNLEMLHCLDLHGADLSKAGGKFGNTALMCALMRWNVRIIDYLLERGVDPFVKDKFGFTAKRKAELKSLRTITSMLDEYETTYQDTIQKKQANNQRKAFLTPITNQEWQAGFAQHYIT